MPATFVLPKQVGFISGLIAPSSVLRFYQTGTSTPQNVYTDVALTNAVTSITADSAGVFQKVYLNPNAAANYRVTLENSAGVVSYTEDDISRFPLTQAEIGAAFYPKTAAESAAGVTPTNYSYPELNVFRYMTAAQVADVQGRALTLDVRASIQSAISVAQQSGGKVILPSGSYLIRRVAGGDSQFNGLHVQYKNVFGYDDHVVIQGDGRSSVLCAGDNNMTVIRWSDSLGALRDFAIDGNGKTGVTGVSLIGSNTASTTLAEHIDWNVISRVDVRSCAEGFELESPAAGGCYFNRFEYCVLYSNTRHIRLRDNATIAGANRNSFIGINMQGGTAGVYNDGADTCSFVQCGFDAVTTAFQQTLVGSLGGLGTNDTQLIGCTWEDCTTDLISPNRRISILGGNCGVAGAVTAVNGIDLQLGGDDPYILRELYLGTSSSATDGIKLFPRAIGYSTQSQVATSSNQAGAYPFNGDGHLIIQGRQSNSHDITIRTGASSEERVRIDGAGNTNLISGVFGLGQSASSAVITNGSTIVTSGERVARVNPGGAVTGIIMAAGTQPGQVCIVINESANSVTFAAYATSRVADGTSAVIAANNQMTFVWDSSTSAWYHS